MIGNKYGIALVDLSYILFRNAFAVSRGKSIGEYNAGDIIRCTIQTLNKIPRDFGITVDKFVLVYDRWDPQWQGYYRTHLLKGLYKDTRGDTVDKETGKQVYITREVFEKMKSDPEVTQEELRAAEEKLYFNETKYTAKWTIIRDLGKFGIPSIGVLGWEFDDLAWLAVGMMYSDEPNAKPNLIITKDSDLNFSTSPQFSVFRIPTSGSLPKVITYEEMYSTVIPDNLKGKISLYNYHCMGDALGTGHNDMSRTIRKGYKADDVIEDIVLRNDWSGVENPEIFKLQMSSFDISQFPRIDEAKRIINDILPTCGRLGTLQEFHEFCDKNLVSGISDRYFSEFISRFDPKLFTER